MPIKLLYISEDEAEFKTLPQSLRDSYIIHHADSFQKAQTNLKHIGKCSVVITEFPHAGKGCAAFFKKLAKTHPHIVRLLLISPTDFSIGHSAIQAASLFQILDKPHPPEILHQVIQKSVEIYISNQEMQRTMRQTLMGSVRAMVDILDMVNPEAMGFAKRIRNRVLSTGKALGVRPLWHLELAVMLSHVGCVALPTDIILKRDKGKALSPEEQQMFDMHSYIASTLVANIHSMTPVAEIIQHQCESLNDKQPLESRIIKTALDVDHMERRGKDAQSILKQMLKKPKAFDKRVVEAMLDSEKPQDDSDTLEIDVERLKEGMIMAQDLVNKDGTKLLLKGQPVSSTSLNIIKSFHITLGIIEPIYIMKQAPKSK